MRIDYRELTRSLAGGQPAISPILDGLTDHGG
jgi:hypothetical protein